MYDTKTALDDEVPVLEIWGVCSGSSFSLPLGSRWSKVVVAIMVPSMGRIDLFESYSYTKEMTVNYLYLE